MADLEIVFMDAGQGDCTLIVYPDGSLMMVDCGSTKSGAEAFGPIKEVINRKFNDKKDFFLVLTHPDQDHYNLLRRLEVEKYIDGGGPTFIMYGGDIDLYRNNTHGENNFTYEFLKFYKEHGVAFPPDNTTNTKPDPLFSRANVKVTVLAANCTGNPAATAGDPKNINSIVLLVEYEGAKIFLMGDAFIETEQFIMRAFKKAGKLDRLRKQDGEHVVLKMGHHGSDTSTSQKWLKLIQPDVIVVSAGTRLFGPTGMPKATHLDATMDACPLEQDTGISQSYVVFDDNRMDDDDPDFIKRPATTKGIWTTCYDAVMELKKVKKKKKKKQQKVYLESGQTWYYGVGIPTNKKKKIPYHWFGYTGYDDDDQDDDQDDD